MSVQSSPEGLFGSPLGSNRHSLGNTDQRILMRTCPTSMQVPSSVVCQTFLVVSPFVPVALLSLGCIFPSLGECLSGGQEGASFHTWALAHVSSFCHELGRGPSRPPSLMKQLPFQQVLPQPQASQCSGP